MKHSFFRIFDDLGGEKRCAVPLGNPEFCDFLCPSFHAVCGSFDVSITHTSNKGQKKVTKLGVSKGNSAPLFPSQIIEYVKKKNVS